MTIRRNKLKFCQSLCSTANLVNLPVLHGKQCEQKAIQKFESSKQLKCHKAGLFIRTDYPYLGATPDGIVGENSTVEVKCPYNGRNELVLPGKNFPFLHKNSSGDIVLREDSKYYAQIQGQMFVSKKKQYYFVVFTFRDLFVQVISIDDDYCINSLIPKLSLFYEKYYRPYLASVL